jgi:hypothetical protein
LRASGPTGVSSALVAVADVAVELGPRNRRRLAAAGSTLAVIAALVAYASLTHWPGGSGAGSSARSTHAGAATANLVFGMTRQQVQHLTGRPTATRGSCWLFRPTATGMVGSISVWPSWATKPYDARVMGDLELCFVGNAYSVAYQRFHDTRAHEWRWVGWPPQLGHATPPQ